ncbi:TetR/AcrR family transcriptional regulator [Sphingobium fluviale]|jgi:AcrR family transcriptional regulator|uniref:TetR/AcrR family transcriptional regulator n=1 Tax=Sphingobium fluviale TaxID=2506423 RepID=A0A4Q1KMW2_9SPHN|nr:TetR/AcrR family transcriptional regulator [Sphingobium fluviale]RXR30865.1 TetR/AcrR family transcriptional regulator [Sphingobium fluviale]
MRYSAEQKLEARARIVEASGRAFRRHGYGGIGVDGLAKEAGVTSGAFYGHFKSKDEAFRGIAVGGLKDLATAIEALQAEHGAAWIDPFIDFYLGERRTCDLGQSCALQSLTPDVMRADETVRAEYEAAFLAVVQAVAQGLTGLERGTTHDRALALLALLSGGVTLARSMASPRMSDDIAEALRAGAMALLHQS